MRTIKIIQLLIIISLLSLLSACGGGGGGTSEPAPTTLSGRVADGYLTGARVFLDRNGNRSLDAGEPWDITSAGGHFSLQVAPGDGDRYPVVAEIIAGQTIDEDQPQETIAAGYRLVAPAGQWSFISPLTTLVKNERDKTPTLSLPEAEARIRSQLGLGAGISLFDDYIQSDDSNAAAAHHAAGIVAGLMGTLENLIEQNVGTALTDDQRTAVELMIDDQIKARQAMIAESLAAAGNPTTREATEAAILADIDSSSLNADLLDRYLDRMQNPAPVWDMTAPKILNQVPAIDSKTSIDVVISLGFDEKLDPVSVSTDSLQLIGPSGPLSGTLTYDPDTRQLAFTPDDYLMAYTDYRVELTGVTDLYGNPLEHPLVWSFTTIFDQLPPALPDF